MKRWDIAAVRILVLLSTILILAGPAIAAGTIEVHVVKYAKDGVTILDETTVNFTWMMDNLDVYGDGITHYYMQGPVFNDTIVDKWNPEENDPAILTKDMGAVKGTDIRDLCDLVGGMSSDDYNITLKATDGLKRNFSYSAVYNPPARTGRMVLTWYRSDLGYVNESYTDGMRNVMFADTTTNPWGYHVLGLWDVHESYPQPFWYYYSPTQPSAQGLSVKYISDIIIYSNDQIPAPVAAFTGTPTSGTAPLTVRFTDASTNSPTSWSWNFGDGNTTNSTVRNPVHTYLSAGTYTVKLTATNTGGSDSETKTNYITGSAPVIAPVAAFTGTPISGTAPLTVRFTDASTNSPTSWSWNFGDGNTTNSTVRNPVHTYLSAGTYTVTLTATNSAGSDGETKTGYVTVTSAVIIPVAAFSGTPTSGTAPLTVRFTDVSTNSPTSWSWNFGDGNTTNATIQSPVHTYLSAGVYSVTLTATNSAGSDSETETDYVTVTASPSGPTVTSISPTTGSEDGGTSVTITGTGFTGATAVRFGTIPAVSYTANSATQITATSPAGTGTVHITVTTPYGTSTTSSADQFTYLSAVTQIGVFRSGQWIIDSDMNGAVDRRVSFGTATDKPVVGDFNNDGTMDIGVYRSGQWILDYGIGGTVDRRVSFGVVTDVPVVGDFNNDGTMDIGVYRSGQWILDYGIGGTVDRRLSFGVATDKPIVISGSD